MRIARRAVPIDYNVFTTISRARAHRFSIRVLIPVISSEIQVRIDLRVEGSLPGTTVAQATDDKKQKGS